MLSGLLKRNRSPELEVNSTSTTISHQPTTIPFGDGIRSFWKKDLTASEMRSGRPMTDDATVHRVRESFQAVHGKYAKVSGNPGTFLYSIVKYGSSIRS